MHIKINDSVHVYLFIYIYIYIYMHICIYSGIIAIHMYLYICICRLVIAMHMYLFIYANRVYRNDICICIYLYMHTYVCTCMYLWIYLGVLPNYQHFHKRRFGRVWTYSNVGQIIQSLNNTFYHSGTTVLTITLQYSYYNAPKCTIHMLILQYQHGSWKVCVLDACENVDDCEGSLMDAHIYVYLYIYIHVYTHLYVMPVCLCINIYLFIYRYNI